MSLSGRSGHEASSGDRLRALATAWRANYPPGAPGRPDLVLVDAIDSTQRWARDLLDACLSDDDEPESFICAALEQASGRGRDRRVWASALGGIYATIVLRLDGEAALQSLPARVAVALATAVNPIVGDRCRIKWPNDLVVGPRKLGGILVDAVSPPNGTGWALVGVGLNHSQREFGSAAAVATSLAAEVGLRLPFFEELFARLIAAVARAAADADSDWLADYRELSAHAPGDEIRARIGERNLDGRFVGFDDHGFLVLDREGGREIVRTGEVFSW